MTEILPQILKKTHPIPESHKNQTDVSGFRTRVSDFKNFHYFQGIIPIITVIQTGLSDLTGLVSVWIKCLDRSVNSWP